jgi:DNA-binding transcriptional LysR family regulator
VDVQQVRCVVAIADHGTFTQAAAALHITQPTLSYTIAKLERELGARLFERSAARTTLTAAGTAFLGPARRALAELRSGHEAVDAVLGLLGGDLRIVGIRTAVVETARHIATFHRRYPAVRLTVENPTFDAEVLDLVRSGRCDVGVMRAGSVSTDDITAVSLGHQTMTIVFPHGQSPQRPSVRLADLRHTSLVVPLPGTQLRALHDTFIAENDLSTSIAAECSDLVTSIELVRSGLGALVTTKSHAESLQLDGLDVRTFRPSIQIELVAIHRPSAAPAALAFAEAHRPDTPTQA